MLVIYLTYKALLPSGHYMYRQFNILKFHDFTHTVCVFWVDLGT